MFDRFWWSMWSVCVPFANLSRFSSFQVVNILLALRLFAKLWSTKKILIPCDNQAVVTVLKSGKTRDAFLAASARNI